MKFSIKEIEDACLSVGMSGNLTADVIYNLPKKRTTLENSSIHKLFQLMADELNHMGHTFVFKGLKGIDIDVKYTPSLVKETIWKPLQDALLSKSSTTELTNRDIQLIFDILAKWFAEKGIEIVFPNKDSLKKKTIR